VSVLEIVTLVVIGIGFLGLILYAADHARQWDDD
jgi:Tfp pilus assembly protein PilV